jgi:hypothetical protein
LNDGSKAFPGDPENSCPDVEDPPKEPSAEQQQGHPYSIEGQQQEEVKEQPLLTWTGVSPGNVVSLVVATTGQQVVGSVETKTSDGLIIWIRDDLNDRRLFHFRDCKSLLVLG